MNLAVLVRSRHSLLWCGAAFAISLTACGQPAATSDSGSTAAAPVASLPPPPAPPPVPQYNRTAEQEQRWQHYLAMKQVYEENLARARNEGRQEQSAADAGRQVGAYNAGRVDQARVDQAQRDLAQAYQQAQAERDPRRREQIIDQAKANLAAAQRGQ